MRESVLFIGTQFSILYTSMYSPAEAMVRSSNVANDGSRGGTRRTFLARVEGSSEKTRAPWFSTWRVKPLYTRHKSLTSAVFTRFLRSFLHPPRTYAP